ncbi:MAG: 30S ribosomal protein S8e [Nanoarchaeota archaeon]
MKLGRKITGGKYLKRRKKKKYEKSGQKKAVKLGKQEKRKVIKTRGGNKKVLLFIGKIINVNQKGETKKTEIKNVLETPSNKFFARQDILTKGTIVETELGKVKITNRPSQEGILNGILVE